MKTDELTWKVPHAGRELVVSRGLSDTLAARIFLDWKDRQLLGTIFYEDPVSLSEFLAQAANPAHRFLVCYTRSLTSDELTFEGLGWVYAGERPGGVFERAEMGFAFQHATPTERKLQFARLMIDWVFEHTEVDLLFGTTPEANTAAVHFAMHLGLQVTGPVPGYTVWRGERCGLMISTLAREDWRGRSK